MQLDWPWHVVSTDAAGVARILFSNWLGPCEQYAASYWEHESQEGEVIAVFSTEMVLQRGVLPVSEAN